MNITARLHSIRNLPVPILNRARSYRALPDYDNAIKDTDTAVRLDPKLAAGYFLRAMIYGEKNDNDRKLTDLDRRSASIRAREPITSSADFSLREKARSTRRPTNILARSNAIRSRSVSISVARGTTAAYVTMTGRYRTPMRRFASLRRSRPDFRPRADLRRKNDYDRKLADLNQAISVSPNVESTTSSAK